MEVASGDLIGFKVLVNSEEVISVDMIDPGFCEYGPKGGGILSRRLDVCATHTHTYTHTYIHLCFIQYFWKMPEEWITVSHSGMDWQSGGRGTFIFHFILFFPAEIFF